MGLVAGCAVGLLVGAQHACQPDHLAALSTLVGERPSGAAWLGAQWGLGHALSLAAIGGVLVGAGSVLPAAASAGLEVAVAVMLVALGVRGLRRAARGEGGPTIRHRHRAGSHRHPGADRHVHVGSVRLALRPLTIGVVHGAAGSGALAALAAGQMPSVGAAVAYVTLFGAGSILGMTLLAAASGAALGRVVPGRRRWIAGASGGLTLICGFVWGWAPLTELL